MEWHANRDVYSTPDMRDGTQLPSLNSQQPASRSWGARDDRSGWADRTSSWGDRHDEEDIFKDLWR
jgi:hypothetical protein